MVSNDEVCYDINQYFGFKNDYVIDFMWDWSYHVYYNEE
jgi:hypothetical protein